MAVTIVEEARPVTCRTAITGGVDTHADTHVTAALDPVGGLLGVREFPATAAGYAGLLGWLDGFGTVALAGREGTRSYGAGLARHRPAAGPPARPARRRHRLRRRWRAAAAGAARAAPGRSARAPGRAHRPAGNRPCPGPAHRLRARPAHRGAAAHRGRGSSRAAAQRGRLGAP